MKSDRRILVVDDFAVMRRIIKGYLSDMGYSNIAEADNGKSALAMMKADPVDLLITDWNMPGTSGLELLRAVRSEPTLAGVPVLLVTANPWTAQDMEATAAGADGFIVKPFSAEVLKQHIEALLAGRTKNAT